MDIGSYIDEIETRANFLAILFPDIEAIQLAKSMIPTARQSIVNLMISLDNMNNTLKDIEDRVLTP